MTNVAEKEKTHKTSSQPLTEYRLTLLEKNYDRLENKVDRLSDKMDARFEQVFKEVGNVRVEMHKMIWQIPAVLAVIMTIIGGLSKLFHWL